MIARGGAACLSLGVVFGSLAPVSALALPLAGCAACAIASATPSDIGLAQYSSSHISRRPSYRRPHYSGRGLPKVTRGRLTPPPAKSAPKPVVAASSRVLERSVIRPTWMGISRVNVEYERPEGPSGSGRVIPARGTITAEQQQRMQLCATIVATMRVRISCCRPPYAGPCEVQ